MIVTLKDFTPPERYDNHPWTTARVEESATASGPWASVQTFTLNPVDTEPSSPQSRSFTTELATVEDGYYRIVFIDGTGDESLPSDAVQFRTDLASQIRPTVRELGELMGARTYKLGKKLGFFNDETTPTAEQADSKIDVATQVVLTKVGTKVTESFYTLCRTAILFKAAALVEMSYYPEQANDDNSAYSLYEDQYNQLMATLVTALSGHTASTPSTLVSVPMVGSRGYVPIGYRYNYGDVDELLA